MTGGLAYLEENLPIRLAPYTIGASACGLVIVDEVNGFATVKAGNLAPQAPNGQVERMIGETDRLAREFAGQNRPIAVFLDSHQPGKPEPPYPPHCERGTGEDELVPALKWLEGCPQATLIAKDCINGFVGAEAGAGRGNRIVAWVNDGRLASIVVVGICTDICVMDFVLTMLSARNHGMMPTLTDIVVYEPGCATYALPRETALSLGLPITASHPQAETHHLGLYFMASRGAVLASALT
ncbi:MAG: isochorismatase family protein [Defluviicoccus sp.]|nr:isochorismatase family protein [Defluviicoccus sp.]MDG4591327.1 isochorismatase family protein [Defluviicoccus sp.]MDS4071578.1 isochorismatase family protein [Defluviicoccus sp.]